MFPWPYIEGLRLDEAMNDLAILSTGLYGKQLLPQNGAPLASRRSLEVRLQEHQIHRKNRIGKRYAHLIVDERCPHRNTASMPTSTPTCNHPRWSQASERVIGRQCPCRHPSCLMDMKKKWLIYIKTWIFQIMVLKLKKSAPLWTVHPVSFSASRMAGHPVVCQ